ncbi:MAG: DoxX family protein [Acidobacteriota bacterium]|nr:DoxX family protein [Acidobacteriota bacterium]
MNIALWIVQALLSAAFFMSGGMKLFAYEKFQKMSKGRGISKGLVTFIGISELAGALGLILPLATHIAPLLTPLAALGLAIIMVLAIGFHIRRKEPSTPAVVLLVLAIFVTIGRGLNYN